MDFDYGIWLKMVIEEAMQDSGFKYQKYREAGIDFPPLAYFIVDNQPNKTWPFAVIGPMPLLADDEIDIMLMKHTSEMIDGVGHFVLADSVVGVIEQPDDKVNELLVQGVKPEDLPGLVNLDAIVAYYFGLGGVLVAHRTVSGDKLDAIEWVDAENGFVDDSLLLGYDNSLESIVLH